MRDPKRIEKILDSIRRIWLEHPDARLGQIVSHAAVAAGADREAIYFVEDDALINGLEIMASQNRENSSIREDVPETYTPPNARSTT